jgi:hypothetical protein
MNFIFSIHAEEQIIRRNISKELILQILNKPNQVISRTGKDIYQSIVTFEDNKKYLVRVFVSSIKKPKVIITVYKTSKIDKYYES